MAVRSEARDLLNGTPFWVRRDGAAGYEAFGERLIRDAITGAPAHDLRLFARRRA